jgi:hypothetical protein
MSPFSSAYSPARLSPDLGLHQSQRLGIVLLVEQHTGKTQARDVAGLVVTRVVHHPFQLGFRAGKIATRHCDLRAQERRHDA